MKKLGIRRALCVATFMMIAARIQCHLIVKTCFELITGLAQYSNNFQLTVNMGKLSNLLLLYSYCTLLLQALAVTAAARAAYCNMVALLHYYKLIILESVTMRLRIKVKCGQIGRTTFVQIM